MMEKETYTVHVTRVIDGDTIVGDVPVHVLDHVVILKDQHFRLYGINAPEPRGPSKVMGLESKAYLDSLIYDTDVQVELKGKDKYGRWLAIVFLDGVNINEHLVGSNLAERRE